MIPLHEFIGFLRRNQEQNSSGSIDQRRRRLSDMVTAIRSTVEVSQGLPIRSESLAAWRDSLNSAASCGQNVLDNDDALAVGQQRHGRRGGRLLDRTVVGRFLACSPRVSKLREAIEDLESKASNLNAFIRLVEFESSSSATNGGSASAATTTANVELAQHRPPRGYRRKRDQPNQPSTDGRRAKQTKVHNNVIRPKRSR